MSSTGTAADLGYCNQDFDTARLIVNQRRFQSNNIDPRTGMPLDSKAVTFENLR